MKELASSSATRANIIREEKMTPVFGLLHDTVTIAGKNRIVCGEEIRVRKEYGSEITGIRVWRTGGCSST